MKFSRHLFIALIFFSAIPIFAQSETEKGVELYRNGDYDQAITVLENVVKANDKDRKAWTYLGASFVKKEKNEEALQAFQNSRSIFIPREQATDLETIKLISKPGAGTEGVENKERVGGRVIFAVELKANGEVGFIFPIKNTLSDGLTKNAIKAVERIKFEPAQKNGKPISIIKFFDYQFTFF